MAKLFNDLQSDFEKWANGLYKSWGKNVGIEKGALLSSFLFHYPTYQQQLTMRNFRKLLLMYCKHNGFKFNPHREGMVDWRDKSNGKEYYVIANEHFDASDICRLNLVEL